jgi:hypothetical protein
MLRINKRSYVVIWEWLQYMIDINNNKVIIDRRKIKCIMIIDETMITIKDEVYWLWLC